MIIASRLPEYFSIDCAFFSSGFSMSPFTYCRISSSTSANSPFRCSALVSCSAPLDCSDNGMATAAISETNSTVFAFLVSPDLDPCFCYRFLHDFPNGHAPHLFSSSAMANSLGVACPRAEWILCPLQPATTLAGTAPGLLDAHKPVRPGAPAPGRPVERPGVPVLLRVLFQTGPHQWVWGCWGTALWPHCLSRVFGGCGRPKAISLDRRLIQSIIHTTIFFLRWQSPACCHESTPS